MKGMRKIEREVGEMQKRVIEKRERGTKRGRERRGGKDNIQ